MEYYLWSVKFNGWMTQGANYSTDITIAQTFSRDEAFKRAGKHYDKRVGEPNILPISVEDWLMIVKQS
jgi:hypothetical protein